MIELLIAMAITAVMLAGAYRMLYVPYRMNVMLHDATKFQMALRALDVVAADVVQADAGSFPAGLITGGQLPAWFSRTDRETDPPYVFVQYAYVPGVDPTKGQLIRYLLNTHFPLGQSTAQADQSLLVLAPVALPGSQLPDGSPAPSLFSADDNNDPKVVTLGLSYEPTGVTLPNGKQAVYTVSRKVSLRN